MREHRTCERCQGNGEIVTDWDRYRHPHEGDKGDESVAECPDCGGEGIIDEPSDCCPMHRFSGSCEDGSCRSATVPIIEILDRPPFFTPRFRDYLAIFAFIVSVAVIGCTIHELRQQEQQFQFQARV